MPQAANSTVGTNPNGGYEAPKNIALFCIKDPQGLFTK